MLYSDQFLNLCEVSWSALVCVIAGGMFVWLGIATVSDPRRVRGLRLHLAGSWVLGKTGKDRVTAGR